MAYAASGLARLGGANGFSLWHYKTADAKAAVDTSGYFNDAANMLNVGDVVISYDTATPTVTLIHNARVGGAPASQHRKLAFDISVRGQDRKDILSALRGAGFSTFGFYQTFIHTDLRLGRRWFGQGADKLWDF